MAENREHSQGDSSRSPQAVNPSFRSAIERYLESHTLGYRLRAIFDHLVVVCAGSELVALASWTEEGGASKRGGLLVVKEGVWSLVTLTHAAAGVLSTTRRFGSLTDIGITRIDLWDGDPSCAARSRCVGLSLHHERLPATFELELMQGEDGEAVLEAVRALS